MYDMDDDFVELLLIPNIGRSRAKTLYSAGYATLADIANADPGELASILGISSEMAREIVDFSLVMASAEKQPDILESTHELMVCPLCGSMVGAGADSCPGCGIAFSDEVEEMEPESPAGKAPDPDNGDFWYKDAAKLFICPECGSMVSDESETCPKCGVEFDDAEEADALPAPKVGDADGYWYTDNSTLFMCPNCGSFIKKDADSCGACGIVFEDGDGEEVPDSGEIACPMCKAALIPGADNCQQCGFDFTAEKEKDGFWYKNQTELFMCPECGAFIPKSASKCGICGTALEEDDDIEPEGPPVCPMCKNELKEGAANCAGCGFDFTAEKEKDGFWYKESSSIFICPGCGAFLSEAADRCMNCGLVFEEGEETDDGTAGEGVKQTGELTRELDSQVDELIEMVEMDEELDAVAGAPGAPSDVDVKRSMDDLMELMEEEDETSSEDYLLTEMLAPESMYLCPVCGAFIESGMSRCPSCSAVLDDIEGMVLEPVDPTRDITEDPKELAREMAAEIENIEAELLPQPKMKGVSKDFLDRWKKLDVTDEGSSGKVWESDAEEQPLGEEFELELPAEKEPVKDHVFWKERAREMASRGRVEEAIAFLDRAVEESPEREMEYKRLMLELMGVGSGERAVDLSELTVVDEIGELAVDEALVAEGKLKRLEEVDRELDADPENGALWQEKGELLEALDRHSEAVECFDKSINISYSELRKDLGTQVQRLALPKLTVGLTNGEGRVNGRVNGLLTQRGLINGALGGRVNGRVSGPAKKPGHVNGLSGGWVNGRVNGLKDGITNGRTNGLINGTGLINGGLVNGLGLVNGEGMVNGSGGLRKLRKRRRERIIWRYRLTAMVLLVTMILMLSMIANMVVQEEGGLIRIDGNMADWNDIQGYYNFLEGSTVRPELQILETRILRENDRLNLFVMFGGDALAGTGGGVDSVWAFVDLDRDAGTGYSMDGMGADIAVEIYGWNRSVMGSGVFMFDANADRNDWNGFSRTGAANAACQGRMLEANIRMPGEYSLAAHNPAVQVITLDSEGNSDITQYIMTQEPGGTVATFTGEGEDMLQPGETEILLGRLTLSAHSMDSAVTGFGFDIIGSGGFADMLNPGLRMADGQVVPVTLTPAGAGFNMTLDRPLEVGLNTTRSLELVADITQAAAGNTLGLALADMVLEEGEATVRNRNVKLHNIGQPAAMSVDGAFGDWASVAGIADPTDDVISPVHDFIFINRNIDLAEARFTVAQNSLYFYLDVHGVMMGGDELPTVRHRPGPPGPPQPTPFADSDRDTVPDHLDPYPFDFNNNGTPDNRTWGTHPDGHTGYDVDGDGRTDYPQGSDRWLNTTIPDTEEFPEEYRGRFVSVYIGPVATAHAHIERKGEDRAYILIDSDNDRDTGQNLKGGLGIDHLMVISGKNNRITAAELYRYQPGDSETGWVFVRNISAATDWTRMEGAVSLDFLGISRGGNFTVYVSTEDWRGSHDTLDRPFDGGLPQDGGTRSPAGDNVVLNEISGFGTAEWVELCNPTGTSIDVSGWTLEIQTGGVGAYKTIYTFPAGSVIGAFGSGQEYLVADLSRQIPDNKMANIRLVSGAGTVDEVANPTPIDGTTHARFKNATMGMPTDTDGAGDWYTSTSPTQGAPNDRTAPIIAVAKTGNTDVAPPEGLVTYTVWYNNTGDGNARHVWVNDTLPAGMTFESSSVPYSSSSGQEYIWHFTNVVPGNHYFTITASVDSGVPQGTVLTNTVRLEYTDQLSRPREPSTDSHDITVVAPQPIISLSKSAEPAIAFPEETLTFTIAYDNVGSVDAYNIWINDTLPAGMTFVSANPAPDYQDGQDVRWYFADAAPGTHSVTLLASVDSGIAPGTVLTNTVTCDYKDSSGESLPRETAQASVTVGDASGDILINEVVSRPNPEWVELANPTSGTVDISGWTIQVQAGGSGNYNAVYTFPAGTTIGAFGSGGEYLVAELPADSLHDRGRDVRLYNSAGAMIDSTTYPAMADGQSWSRFKHEDTGKPDDGFYISNNNWLVPEGPTPGGPNDRKRPVMTLEKSVAPDTAEPGQAVTYTITYSNTGDGNAKNVWVNDTLPPGVDFVSATPAPTDVSGQDLVWYFNNVNRGTTNYITINARVNDLPADGETVVNTATLVYHDALRRPMGTAQAWANFTCVRANITVSKVADVSTVQAGGTIVYTIYYNNTGSANAGSVWINDTLPEGVEFVSASPAPDTVSGQELQWHFTDVAPGTHSITVTVTVDGNATGTLINWAFLDYASAYGYGLDPSSDSAIVVIPEMRHLAIPAFGIMFMGFIYLKRRRQNHGKKI